MIKYFNGTVFNADTHAIVNTINTVGVMGAGLALEFALRYPLMFEDYKVKCETGIIKVCKVDYYKDTSVTIVNFPTKWHFKYPSKLSWIEEGLKDFVNTYKKYDIKSIAFPRLGCSNGGLNWQDVKPIMEKYLSNLDIDVYICLDSISEADGKEGNMVKLFNHMDIDDLSEYVKLNATQKELLDRAKPIKRFYKLFEIKGIGIKKYSELFNYFYHFKEDNQKQISLFD